MRKCCCCIGLRTACIIIGLLFLLVDGAALVWSALGAADKVDAWPEAIQSRYRDEYLDYALYAIIGVAAMSVLCDLLLIQGAAQHQRCPLLCWLLWTGLLLVLFTIGLLALLGISIWLLVDETAAEQLGVRDDIRTIFDTLHLTEEERRAAEQHTHLVLLISTVVALIVMSILWGWFSAVDAYYRRLKHAVHVEHIQYVHTSRM